MNITEKIGSIYSFNLNAELFVHNDGDIFNIQGIKLYHLEKARFIFFISKNYTFLLNNRNLGYLIKQDGLEIFDKKVKLIGCTDKFILTYDRENNKKAVFSIEENKIIFESNNEIGDFLNNEFLITDFNSIIQLVNIQTGKIKVKYSLNNLGVWFDSTIEKKYQVSEFSGIYNNILITTFTNGDILLLDIEKGEPIKLLKDTKVLGGIFQKKDSSPIYIGLKFKTYIEIDVEKAEIIKKIDLEEYFKQKFNRTILVPINTTVYQKGLIYFIADTNIVGVFDPEKTEVIDFYEFKFENKQTMLKGGKENLQVKENNVYCLDNQDNLYTLNLTPPS